MKLLPHWYLTRTLPAYNDGESATALEQTHKLYNSMNALITEYNQFVDETNDTLNQFIEKYGNDMELFTTSFRQEFQDFIDIVDLKLAEFEDRLSNIAGIGDLDLTDINNTLNALKDDVALLKTQVENIKSYDELKVLIENDFYTKSQIDSKIDEKIDEATLTIERQITEVQDNLNSDITNLSNRVEDLENADNTTDLSNYYTKDESYSKSEVDTKIANVSTGGTVDLGNYVDKSSSQEITGTKRFSGNVEVIGKLWDRNLSEGNNGQILSSTGSGVEWIDPPSGESTDLSNYYTKEETEALHNALVNKTGNQEISGEKNFFGKVSFYGNVGDSEGQSGTAGQILSSTGSGVEWIDAPSGGSSGTESPTIDYELSYALYTISKNGNKTTINIDPIDAAALSLTDWYGTLMEYFRTDLFGLGTTNGTNGATSGKQGARGRFLVDSAWNSSPYEILYNLLLFLVKGTELSTSDIDSFVVECIGGKSSSAECTMVIDLYTKDASTYRLQVCSRLDTGYTSKGWKEMY